MIVSNIKYKEDLMFNINGLSNDEVKEARKKYGNNSISGKSKNTFFGTKEEYLQSELGKRFTMLEGGTV